MYQSCELMMACPSSNHDGYQCLRSNKSEVLFFVKKNGELAQEIHSAGVGVYLVKWGPIFHCMKMN